MVLFIDWSIYNLHSQQKAQNISLKIISATCFSIQAHDGRVISTAHSPSYVVSMGEDGKLCVWERFHGHLINSIHLVSNHSIKDYYSGLGRLGSCPGIEIAFTTLGRLFTLRPTTLEGG